MSSKRIIDRFRGRPGSVFNLAGMSSVPRSDGSSTFIPKEYFSDIDKVVPLEVLQKIAYAKPTIIVRALSDEIIGLTRVNEIQNAEHIDIEADHNFTGENRSTLIKTLGTIL